MEKSTLIEEPKIIRFPADSTHLFIADAHLGAHKNDEKSDKAENSLIELVKYCQKNGYYLHVLGDLFDYWMEYPENHTPSVGANLRETFKNYHQSFGPTLYITGNHDNWDYQHFRNLGFDVEHEYRLIKFGDTNLLALHGDGLKDKKWNLPRPLLHQMLRNRYFINLFQKIFPPNKGWKIMRLFSLFSRWGELRSMHHKQHKLNGWARKCLSSQNLDGIIFGHDHKPRKYNFEDSFFINPGSFELFNSLVIYTSGQFEIVKWNDIDGLSETIKKYYINRL